MDRTDLVCLNNRHYDPATGTFLSVDPLVVRTAEPYIYGAANPITFSDPTGLDPDTAAWVRHRAEEDDGDYPSPKDSVAKSTNNGCTYSSSRWGCDTRTDKKGPEYLPYVPPPGWEHRPYDVLNEAARPVSKLLGDISDASGGLGVGCTVLSLAAGVGAACVGPAFGVSAVTGVGEVIALVVEGDERAPCKAAVVSVEAILPGPVGADRVGKAFLALTRSVFGFGAGAGCG